MTQAQALDIMKLGFNIFLTGPPGAGKTYVLNQYIDYLQAHEITVGITASTGIAATHIGGMTIHSWSGIGIADELDEQAIRRITANAQLLKRMNETKVLIIDEVSMLHGARLDMVNQICKAFKDETKPFGGLQVILTGDLYQLPPVTRERSVPTDFVFKSNAWRELNLKVCYIHEQHRADDNRLLQILDAIRSGDIDDAHYEMLMQYQNSGESRSTRLFTHNADVDSLNNQQLQSLDGDSKTFTAETSGRKNAVESLKKSVLAPEQLELRIGAEVMCVANKPQLGIVNGSRGTVKGFHKTDGHPIITMHDFGRTITFERHSWTIRDGERTIAEYSQYPLRLAWAITVHKSQGMSLDEAEIDLSKSFEPGMGYVALSRLRSLEGLSLRGINNTAFLVHADVQSYDGQLRDRSDQAVQSIDSLSNTKRDALHKTVRIALSPKALEYDKDLFEKLRDWRITKAKSESKPAYTILPDKALKELAAYKPTDEKSLQRIHGIGPAKLERYADELLKLVQ